MCAQEASICEFKVHFQVNERYVDSKNTKRAADGHSVQNL